VLEADRRAKATLTARIRRRPRAVPYRQQALY